MDYIGCISGYKNKAHFSKEELIERLVSDMEKENVYVYETNYEQEPSDWEWKIAIFSVETSRKEKYDYHFMREDSNFYHVFKMLHVEHSDRVIEGLQLVFIELPKFKPQKMGDKKMAVLWLRYLTEIDEKTKHAPIEMLDDPEVNKALNVIEESAFSDAQLRGYEKFWDGVSVERTLYNGGWKQGKKEGREEGLREGRKEGIIVGIKEGREEGRKKGSEEERLKNAKALKELGVSFEIITKVTGLTLTEIIAL